MILLLALLVQGQTVVAPKAAPGPRLETPLTHDNLAIYLIENSEARPGETYITLEEGLRAGKVRVSEKGSGEVNELVVENLSKQTLFLQAGDGVKGGRQDRVLTMDRLVPPRSGRVTVPAYCVESGRWTGGYGFGGSAALVMGPRLREAVQTEKNQDKVWEAVKEMKDALVKTNGLATSRSTSLNEQVLNPKIQKRLAAFHKALGGACDKKPLAVGMVAAVNGKPRTSDLYADPALFRKLYPRLLASAALDAMSTPAKDAASPAPEDVAKALAAAKRAFGDDFHRQTLFE